MSSTFWDYPSVAVLLIQFRVVRKIDQSKVGMHFPEGTAWQNAMVAMLVTLCKSLTLDPAKQPQTITLPPSRLTFDVTCWGTILLLTWRCKENLSWSTKDFKSWCISPWHLLPVFSSPLAVFHGPGKPFFSYPGILAMAFLLQLNLSNLQLKAFSLQSKMRLAYHDYSWTERFKLWSCELAVTQPDDSTSCQSFSKFLSAF